MQTHKPTVVVLDLTTLDVDGYEVFRQIRERPDTREIAVLVTHPHPTDADVFRAWQLNSQSFLSKPINLKEVVTFIDRVVADT